MKSSYCSYLGGFHVLMILFQIIETTTPGLYKLWALIGSDLHVIKVHVPRIFYVNCCAAKEGTSSSKYCYAALTKTSLIRRPLMIVLPGISSKNKNI